MMLELQALGCHNINFVTPEHVVPQILEALPCAIDGGLRLPIVYNTSAYDSLHSLQLMDGVVDIYMPDFKYVDPRLSSHYLKARDYPERAMAAIREMHRQVGRSRARTRTASRAAGCSVRHLVMPDAQDDTERMMAFLAELSPNTYVNVMDQYYPAGRVAEQPERYEALNRRTTAAEHQRALQAARRAGLQRLDQRDPHPLLIARRQRRVSARGRTETRALPTCLSGTTQSFLGPRSVRRGRIAIVETSEPPMQLQQIPLSVFKPKPPPLWYVTNGEIRVGPVLTGLLKRGVEHGRVPDYCRVAAYGGSWRKLKRCARSPRSTPRARPRQKPPTGEQAGRIDAAARAHPGRRRALLPRDPGFADRDRRRKRHVPLPRALRSDRSPPAVSSARCRTSG